SPDAPCLPPRHAILFAFFQAEDGIRYPLVTGVQTCALPIFATVSSVLPPSITMYSRFGYPCSKTVRIVSSINGSCWYEGVTMLKIGRASCREREENAVEGE